MPVSLHNVQRDGHGVPVSLHDIQRDGHGVPASLLFCSNDSAILILRYRVRDSCTQSACEWLGITDHAQGYRIYFFRSFFISSVVLRKIPFVRGVCFRPHPLTTPMRLVASAPRPHFCGFLADDGISHAIYTTSMS